MKNVAITISLLFIVCKSWAQAGNWDVYLAQYEKGPGSTTVNMDLIKFAPKKGLAFVLVTGVTTANCREDGFPNSFEFERLYQVSEAVETKVKELTKFELAGTFTYQCERLDYIYVSDTTSIRSELAQLYNSQFPHYKYYINLRADADWEAYREFLYPNEETLEFMANEKVLFQLRQAGDNLSEPRQIDHWLYFPDRKSQNLFMESIKNEGFKIEGEDKIGDSRLPFQLHISRIDKVLPDEIYQVTLHLRKQAKRFNGEYDGWETFVVKK